MSHDQLRKLLPTHNPLAPIRATVRPIRRPARNLAEARFEQAAANHRLAQLRDQAEAEWRARGCR